MQTPTYGPGIPYSPAAQFLMQQGMWDETPEPPVQLPPQVDTALDLIRAGLSEIEVRLELQKVYGKGAKPAYAFQRALAMLVEEEKRGLDTLPERVQAIRFRAIQGAMRDRSWGAVATLLRDALPQAPVSLSEAAAELLIKVEAELPAIEASDAIQDAA